MVAMTHFTVTAERGTGPVWVFQCVEHPGAISQSRRLADYDDLMREAIGFVAEVDAGDVMIDLDVRLPGDLQDRARAARALIGELDTLQRTVAATSRAVARELVRDHKLTGADAAAVLGVSQQRVSQLVNS